MPLVWIWFSRLLGILLICLAFLYENEEGQIQYRLEMWDKALAARGTGAHSAVAAFMGGVAQLTGRFLDRLFGRSLLSFRVVGVSICYSLASFFLFAELSGFLVHAINKNEVAQHAPLGGWFWFIFFISLGSIPAIVDRGENEPLWLWGLCVFTTVAAPAFQAVEFVTTQYGPSQALRVFIVVGLVLAVSFGFDVFFIALIRWMLRQASDAKNELKTIGIMILNCVIAAFLILSFPIIGLAMDAAHADPIVYGTVMAVNFLDIVISSAFFVLLVLILIHRVTWPLLQRPIHACVRHKLIMNKKLLWGLGCALILAPEGMPLWRLLLQGH